MRRDPVPVGPVDVTDPLRSALRTVVEEAYAVEGALFATADGILLAAEFDPAAPRSTGAHPESVAALAAATSGVAGRFAGLTPIGETTAAIIQGTRGCVAVQPIGPHGVLVLYGSDGSTAARLHLAARQAVPIVGEALRGGGS
jgi:uncharacterized protein